MAVGNQTTSLGLADQMNQFAINLGGAASASDGLGELWKNINTAASTYSPASGTDVALAPTGSLGATMNRYLVTSNAAVISATAGTTGTLFLQALYLQAGTVCTNANILIHTAPTGTLTHQWMCLCDSGRVVRAVTGDNTTTLFTADTVWTQAFGSTFTTTYSGLYYLGFMIAVGTTIPTAWGALTTQSSVVTGLAPILTGASSTSQGAPPAVGGTAQTAITAGTTPWYGYVS